MTESGSISAPIYRHESIASTNTEALRLGEAGEPHHTVVIADYQTAGRGKLDRKWLMPPKKGVLLSIILRDMPPGVAFASLTLQVGWRLANRLRAMTGLQIDVKQPNDLMFQGKKLGGILSEARWRGEELVFAVVGVGINVNVAEFPEELRESATSLALAAGREFEVEEIIQAVIEELRGIREREAEEKDEG